MKINNAVKFEVINELRTMARNKDVFIGVNDFYLDYTTKELIIKYKNGKEELARDSKYADDIRKLFKNGIIID